MVAIEMAVSTKGQLIVKARMNTINHLYIMTLDLWELERSGGKKKKRTRVVNTYNNNFTVDQIWGAVGRSIKRRELADAECDRILGGRTVLLGHFNTQSPQ